MRYSRGTLDVPHMGGSDIGDTPPKALDRKNVSMCCTERGRKSVISIQVGKQLFHVHGTPEKGIGILSKVKDGSNPRNQVRNHWWPPGYLVSLVHRSGDN